MFDTADREGILRSEVYLTTRHTPETPIGREKELDQIATALRPLTQRIPAENLLIHGPAGVGKTTCVRDVLNRLDGETGVRTFYINCWQYNTRPSLLTELLIQMGYPAPRKGKPVDEMLNKLRELLNKSRGFAIALDEFDQLRDGADIVYDFHLLSEEAEHELGLILVSNQPPGEHEFGSRGASRLQYRELPFSPYTATEIYHILMQRVEQAYRSNAVPEELVEDVAEHVASEGGDCRQALELVLQAGRQAEREGDTALRQEHLDVVLDEESVPTR